MKDEVFGLNFFVWAKIDALNQLSRIHNKIYDIKLKEGLTSNNQKTLPSS